MTSPSPTELLSLIQAFNSDSSRDVSTVDPVLRKSIQRAAAKLSQNFEEPGTAVFRLTMGHATESAALKIALDRGLFPTFGEDGGPKDLHTLAEGTNTEPALVLRILRFLATCGVVVEADNGKYSLAKRFSLLGSERYAKAANKCVDLTKPMIEALPGLIQENGGKNPEDRLNSGAQRAFNMPGKEIYEALKSFGPETVEAFSLMLEGTAKDSAKVHEVYPVQERLIDGFDSSKHETMWVDVGGSLGQYTLDLKQNFPQLPGRCVVEDQEPVVAFAKAKGVDKQVDFIAHDFFTEQPIKGARAYYLRQIFHNWQDANCKVILERIAAVMQPSFSRILVHDIVMPEREAGMWEVMMDWLMMSGYSTLERTEKQWRDLVESSGLKLNKIYSSPNSAESIVEIVKE